MISSAALSIFSLTPTHLTCTTIASFPPRQAPSPREDPYRHHAILQTPQAYHRHRQRQSPHPSWPPQPPSALPTAASASSATPSRAMAPRVTSQTLMGILISGDTSCTPIY